MAAAGQRTSLDFLDAALDPDELWRQGLECFGQKRILDAAWYLTVSLFIKYHVDKEKVGACISVLEAYLAQSGGQFDHPIIQALSLPLLEPRKQEMIMQRAFHDAHTYETSQNVSGYYSESATSLDQVDRKRFGYAMIFVFAARIKGNQMAQIPPDAPYTTREQAARIMYERTNMVRHHIDANKWLAMHFELGFGAYERVREPDGTLEEARSWFTKLIEGINAVEAANGRLPPHLNLYKQNSEHYLSRLPLMEDSIRKNAALVELTPSGMTQRRFGTHSED